MDWFSIITIGVGLIFGTLLFIGSLITDNGFKNRENEYVYRFSIGIFFFIIGNLVVYIWFAFFYMIFIIIFK